MLRTRLVVGTLLAIGAALILWQDRPPNYPGWLGLLLTTATLAARELLALFPPQSRPRGQFTIPAVLILHGSHWIPWQDYFPGTSTQASTWLALFVIFLTLAWLAVGIETVAYDGGGQSTSRLTATLFVLIYLGLFPAGLIQLRWWPDSLAGTALALTIFVPKAGDIGAYFTGRLIGRHPLAPRLSPKKTWEGFVGGLLASILAAVLLAETAAIFPGGRLEAAAFGFLIGLASVVGDLAESLLKRDALVKDASTTVPGFGGLLDVIDSIILAAPLAYLWLSGCPGLWYSLGFLETP
jgi:phosphatidate cytidylyltransferase